MRMYACCRGVEVALPLSVNVLDIFVFARNCLSKPAIAASSSTVVSPASGLSGGITRLRGVCYYGGP